MPENSWYVKTYFFSFQSEVNQKGDVRPYSKKKHKNWGLAGLGFGVTGGFELHSLPSSDKFLMSVIEFILSIGAGETVFDTSSSTSYTDH